MKYINRIKAGIKVKYLFIVFVILLFCISSSYALFSSQLQVKGTVKGSFESEVLKLLVLGPPKNPGRLVSLSGLKVQRPKQKQILESAGDEYIGNDTVVCKLRHVGLTEVDQMVKPRITLQAKNDNGSNMKNGNVEITKNDPSGVITIVDSNPNGVLSNLNVKNGSKFTVLAKLNINANKNIPVGTYVNYRFSYEVNNVRKFYNLKILIVQ